MLATMPQIKAKQQIWQRRAQKTSRLMSPAIVFSTPAQGASLSTVADVVISESEATEINKQAQWKILAIVRHLSLLVADAADAAQAAGHSFIPNMREHFGFFCGDDNILRRYKTWPPRGVS
jgi:hypothetical protein